MHPLAGYLTVYVSKAHIIRAPELFPAIKADVDRNRTPGRYLLTGSANSPLKKCSVGESEGFG